MTNHHPIEAQRLSGALGAQLSGFDLQRDLNPELIAQLRKLWLEHGVIFMRDQNLTSEQFQAFAQSFGEIIEYPFVQGLPDNPLIIPVLKLPHETHNFGGVWHTDTAYLEQPPMATILIGREIPPYGGDTLFACGYAAYDALSDGLKATLSTMRAVNSSAKADVTKTREDRLAQSATDQANTTFISEHPVVRTHPETGKKALFVNFAHTTRFAGWTEEESEPLLNYLYAHQVRPEFTCRFPWAVNSIAFWDNRRVLHNPVNDYHGHKRLLHRITLQGDTPQ